MGILNGCFMLLMNIGSRYLYMEFPKSIDYLFINYRILRWLVVFSIAYIATKNFKLALLLTLIFILVFKYILDSDKKTCIINMNKN